MKPETLDLRRAIFEKWAKEQFKEGSLDLTWSATSYKNDNTHLIWFGFNLGLDTAKLNKEVL